MIKHHYHATLICGHNVSFDTEQDLEARARSEGADGYEVEMRCAECGAMKQSLVVTKVGLAGAPCTCIIPDDPGKRR